MSPMFIVMSPMFIVIFVEDDFDKPLKPATLFATLRHFLSNMSLDSQQDSNCRQEMAALQASIPLQSQAPALGFLQQLFVLFTKQTHVNIAVKP